jgi:RNA polymerase sigma-70 factor (ECF subfamily)
MEDFKNKKDEEVVKEVLKNPDFYSEIIFRYQGKINRYILRIAKISTEDSQDLTQDVFLSAYKNLNSFDNDFSFSSWIYRIAHNTTINF